MLEDKIKIRTKENKRIFEHKNDIFKVESSI